MPLAARPRELALLDEQERRVPKNVCAHHNEFWWVSSTVFRAVRAYENGAWGREFLQICTPAPACNLHMWAARLAAGVCWAVVRAAIGCWAERDDVPSRNSASRAEPLPRTCCGRHGRGASLRVSRSCARTQAHARASTCRHCLRRLRLTTMRGERRAGISAMVHCIWTAERMVNTEALQNVA